jgi:L-ascorbate 6-phosphate lactonase
MGAAMGLMDEILSVRVEPGRVALWWLGQSGYVLKTPGGLVAAIDPYLTDGASDGGHHERRFPPPIAPADLRCDIIFCTHDHPDHTDPATLLPALDRSGATIVAPPTSCARLAGHGVPADRRRTLRVGDAVEHGDLRVVAAPAFHGESGPPERRPRRPVPDPIGLLITCGPVRCYHTGDTLYDEGLLAVAAFRPRTLLVCINGRGGNMNADEAARLAAELDVAVAIPMHYGTIAVNDADPQTFVEAMRRGSARIEVALLPVARRYDLMHDA